MEGSITFTNTPAPNTPIPNISGIPTIEIPADSGLDLTKPISFTPPGAIDVSVSSPSSSSSIDTNIDTLDFLSTEEIQSYAEAMDGLQELGITSPIGKTQDEMLATQIANGSASNGNIKASKALASEVQGVISISGTGGLSLPAGNTLSQDFWTLQTEIMADGTHNFPPAVQKQQREAWKRMPTSEALTAIQAWNNQFGQKPVNGFNPKNWGAGEWIAATTLLVQYMQNKEILEESQERYDAQEKRNQETHLHNMRMNEENLALSKAQLAQNKPGKGGSIGRTSIYS